LRNFAPRSTNALLDDAVSLERLWAGWRTEYVASAGQEGPSDGDCVFCRILNSGQPDTETYILRRSADAFAILNAYPYTSGHVLVMPTRHVADLDELRANEGAELWNMLASAASAIKSAYQPDGMNIGANIGRAGGAGIPGHFHLHALPRWAGDTNFMTAIAEVRVLPEALDASAEKLRAAWH
jgi:ATP adenylyltransferase